ncbi:MAG TPA: SIMPL domain-containing protein [Spirochaetia bacterium]|nr:SIMPL domain-containing protein [Spirochaetia bacterium]
MKPFTKILFCLAAAALSAALTVPSQAQEVPTFRHVDVVGEAEVRAVPDQVLVTLGVESWGVDLMKTRQDNDLRVSRLLAVPGRFGVATSDVRTAAATIEPQYDTGDRGQVRAIAGYRLTKLVVVRLTDLNRVEGFVSEALAAGANRLDSVTFGLTDPAPLRTQARVLAVKDALAKAGALASETGQALGRPLSLAESTSTPYPQPMFKALAAEADGSGGNTFAPGQVTVTCQVSAQFELKDR